MAAPLATSKCSGSCQCRAWRIWAFFLGLEELQQCANMLLGCGRLGSQSGEVFGRHPLSIRRVGLCGEDDGEIRTRDCRRACKGFTILPHDCHTLRTRSDK